MRKTRRKTASAARDEAADKPRTAKEIAVYLETVFERGDTDVYAACKALGYVARTKGMREIAKEIGINREHLYRALSGTSNPRFDTVLKLLHALGVELCIDNIKKVTTDRTR